jgi:hypothetical protein
MCTDILILKDMRHSSMSPSRTHSQQKARTAMSTSSSASMYYMPTPSRTHSHPLSCDYSMNVEDYFNYPSDDSHSLTSFPSTSVESRWMQDPPRPTDPETEAYLRKSIPIAEGKPVNLSSLPDSSAKTPKISDMIKLAIWGSRNHKLTLRQIYDEIEDRYPHLKDAQDKPWQVCLASIVAQVMFSSLLSAQFDTISR